MYVPETCMYVPEVPTRGGEGVVRVPFGSRALLAPARPDIHATCHATTITTHPMYKAPFPSR